VRGLDHVTDQFEAKQIYGKNLSQIGIEMRTSATNINGNKALLFQYKDSED
jgi:hypothetical protein